MSIRKIIKDWLPPALARAIGAFKGIRFAGAYPTWEEARRRCSGYESDQILEKVLEATNKVVQGEGAFERDSVVFNEVQFEWPVVAGLLLGAKFSCGKLSVLDFGGSLGSSYFQHKHILQLFDDVVWNIVEQPKFVEAGKKIIREERLNFFASIYESAYKNRPNVILLSSVLQYLPNPYGVLKELIDISAKIIILDKTIVNLGVNDKVYIQRVPAEIYNASYPCWSLSEERLVKTFEHNYYLLADFPGIEFPSLLAIDSKFKGYIFMKRA